MTPAMLHRPAFDRVSCGGTAARGALWGGLTMLAAASVLTGCFTSTGDFKAKAEKSIAERVAPEVGAEFTSVNCDEPLDQQIGTRFACQAIDADGGVWEFDNVIDVEGEFTVTVAQRP